MWKIVETFYSVQSEGFHSGRAAFFIRFYGCNLQCNFGSGMKCDEPLHTEADEITLTSTADLVEKADGRFVVITGGEPSLHNINTLITALKYSGCYVAVETNGYNWSNINLADWITWSPKVAFDIKAPTLCDDCFNELKLLAGVNNPVNMKAWENVDTLKYVQPIADGNHLDPFNTTYCVDFIKKNTDWHLSLQFHKYIGLE